MSKINKRYKERNFAFDQQSIEDLKILINNMSEDDEELHKDEGSKNLKIISLFCNLHKKAVKANVNHLIFYLKIMN